MTSAAFKSPDEEINELLDRVPTRADFALENLQNSRTDNISDSIGTRAAFQLYPTNRRSERKSVKQEFVGVVISVEDNEFTAEIRDVFYPKNPDEEVTMLLDEVPDNDKCMIQPGNVFNWYIGIITERGFQATNEPYSKIVFRRLPSRKEKDFIKASKEAEELVAQFKSND